MMDNDTMCYENHKGSSGTCLCHALQNSMTQSNTSLPQILHQFTEQHKSTYICSQKTALFEGVIRQRLRNTSTTEHVGPCTGSARTWSYNLQRNRYFLGISTNLPRSFPRRESCVNHPLRVLASTVPASLFITRSKLKLLCGLFPQAQSSSITLLRIHTSESS